MWNSEAGHFEVAMQLDAVALADGISVSRNSPFRLEVDDTPDTAIRDHVAARFELRHPDAESSTIRWVGHELELHSVRVYFEVVPQTDPAGLLPQPVRLKNPNVGNIFIANCCLLNVRPDSEHMFMIRNIQQELTIHGSDRETTALAEQVPKRCGR